MTTFLRHCFTATVLLGLLATAPVQAQSAHIGFVKVERIFTEAASAKAAQARLTEEFSKQEKEIADKSSAFKAEVDKFQTESPTLAESQRQARQKQLGDQDRTLQMEQRKFQESLNARKQEELQKLLANVNAVIKKMAETEKYDFIFQAAVYVNPKLDLTDKVLKIMNSQPGK